MPYSWRNIISRKNRIREQTEFTYLPIRKPFDKQTSAIVREVVNQRQKVEEDGGEKNNPLLMSFLILRKDEFDAFGCEKNSLFFFKQI